MWLSWRGLKWSSERPSVLSPEIWWCRRRVSGHTWSRSLSLALEQDDMEYSCRKCTWSAETEGCMGAIKHICCHWNWHCIRRVVRGMGYLAWYICTQCIHPILLPTIKRSELLSNDGENVDLWRVKVTGISNWEKWGILLSRCEFLLYLWLENKYVYRILLTEICCSLIDLGKLCQSKFLLYTTLFRYA